MKKYGKITNIQINEELLNSIIIDIKKEKYNRFYDSIYYYAPNN